MPVACAAHEPGALESVLFGANPQDIGDPLPEHPGALVCARGGTLFLDEVTALSCAAQERIAREFSGAGQDSPRLIAGTSANLALELSRGRFDADLFQIFDGIAIRIPPLRERPEDIPGLARRALEQCGLAPDRRPALTDQAADMLSSYYWPGNERELGNVVERAAMRTSNQALAPEDILPHLSRPRRHTPDAAMNPDEYHFPSLETPLSDVEREYIARVLQHAGFHRQRTAEILGITRKTLYSKLKQYDLIDTFVRREAGR